MRNEKKKLDRKAIQRFEERMQKEANKLFGTMDDGAPWLRVDTIDRAYGHRPSFDTVPYTHDAKSVAEFYESMRSAWLNFSMAHSNLETEFRCFESVMRDRDEEYRLKKLVMAKSNGAPVRICSGYSVASLLGPNERWASMPYDTDIVLDREQNGRFSDFEKQFMAWVPKALKALKRLIKRPIREVLIVTNGQRYRMLVCVPKTADEIAAEWRQRAEHRAWVKANQALVAKEEKALVNAG